MPTARKEYSVYMGVHVCEDHTMKYFDKEGGSWLKSAFEEVVLEWPAVTATTMFGCPSYRVEGTLFSFLVTDGVVLTRLPGENREQVTQSFESGPFEAGERTVATWVKVTIENAPKLDALFPHIKASYASALEDADQ